METERDMAVFDALVSAVTGALKTVCCTGVHHIPAVVVFLLSRTLLIDSKGIFLDHSL
jgi:hypothetical protein